jgi:O-antigen/teichoic acid export membrane protein
MIILPIAILLIVYAQEAVEIIYGSGFELTAYILSLYMITYLLVGLGYNTLGSFFAGIGETKTNLKITIINSITLIVLAPLLTYSLKVTGIIIALILSSLVGTMYGLYTAKKSYGVKTDSKMLMQIYFVALVPILPIFGLKWMIVYSNFLTMILGATIYFAIYLIMIPITGVITPTELEEVKKILEKIKFLNYLAKPILYCEERIFKVFSKTQPTQ